jgi:hypothetical protein
MLQKALNDNWLCRFAVVTHAGEAALAHAGGMRLSPRFLRACAALRAIRASVRKFAC